MPKVMKTTTENFTGIDAKEKRKIDRIITQFLTIDSEKADAECKELVGFLCTHISQESFYAFHKLVQGIYDHTCKWEKLTDALVEAANFKTLLWACDLMLAGEEERACFFTDLWKLDLVAHAMFSPEIRELESEVRTFYGFLFLLLHNYSREMMILLFHYPFRHSIHVKCGKCGNEIHSVFVHPDEIPEEYRKNFSPRMYDPEKDGLSEAGLKKIWEQKQISESETAEGQGECDYDDWDVFQNSMRLLKTLDEEYLTQILPYLYGTHSCGMCKETEVVAESAWNWIDQEMEIFTEPKEELITWLMSYAKRLKETDGQGEDEENRRERADFMLKMAIWYEKAGKQPKQERVYRNILEIYKGRTAKDIPLCVKKLQYIIRQMTDADQPELLAELYHFLAGDCTSDFMKEERNRYDLAYKARKKALELLVHNQKTDTRLYRNVMIGLSILTAESQEGSFEEAEQGMLELIEKEKNRPDTDIEELGELYNKLAYLSAYRAGDYKKTYQYYGRYLESVRQIYGEGSDMEADSLEELAEYHEMDGDFEGACQLREKALEINLQEMGKLYLLPPIFKGLAITTAKLIGAIDENDKFSRVMSVADSYTELAVQYEELGHQEAAFSCRQKAVSLLEWEFKGKSCSPCMAELHKQIGDYYAEHGKESQAKKEWERAKEICQSIILENRYEDEVEECQELLEEFVP